LLGLLLTFFSAMCKISAVEASGTIHINVFGVVVSSSAPIQRNGSLYTFTADISEAIQIEANDIIVDGAGHTVQGSGTGTGTIVGARGEKLGLLPIVTVKLLLFPMLSQCFSQCARYNTRSPQVSIILTNVKGGKRLVSYERRRDYDRGFSLYAQMSSDIRACSSSLILQAKHQRQWKPN